MLNDYLTCDFKRQSTSLGSYRIQRDVQSNTTPCRPQLRRRERDIAAKSSLTIIHLSYQLALDARRDDLDRFLKEQTKIWLQLEYDLGASPTASKKELLSCVSERHHPATGMF